MTKGIVLRHTRHMLRKVAATTCLIALFAAGGTLANVGSGAQTRADTAPSRPINILPWAMIGAKANATVAAQSPNGALPFQVAVPGSGRALVIAHYFPPYPMSIGNLPAGQDYYARNYLNPEGENGKFRRQGGLLRNRPLPTEVKQKDQAMAANLAIEVAQAARIGIDAFAVDLLQIGKGNLWDTSVTLLDAAAAVSPNFRIIPQPDMVALKAADVPTLADALIVFARHSAAYHLPDGRLLVMPFAAEARPPAYWLDLIATMRERGVPIAYAPVFVSGGIADQAKLAWAAGLWSDSEPSGGARSAMAAAQAKRLGIDRWIFTVSPQDYRPKNGNLWEARNSEGYRQQWTAAIDGKFDIVEIVTWNDYSESTVIAPSAASQFSFYDLTAYYIAWIKRGSPPAITSDALYWFHRKQIVDPIDPARGPNITVRSKNPLSNDVELVAMLRSPGRISVGFGSRSVTRDVGAGLQSIRIGAAPGRPNVALSRNGRRIAEATSQWTIDDHPSRHDATYAGGSTTRAFIDVPGGS